VRTIGGLFGRSAFGPLHEQVLKTLDCTRTVCELVEAHAAGDWEKVAATAARLHELESEADNIKGEIRNSLSASLFSSVERGEVLFLIKHIDHVADLSEETAKFLEVRRTPVPEPLADDYRALGRKVCECADVLGQVMAELVKMEADPAGRSRTDDVYRMIDRVHQLEHESDMLQQGFLKSLFSMEKDLDPMSVVMLMRISERLAFIADQVENNADVIARMVAKL
jgi:predicted phosphate transport protein (TIGR00153 family)